MPKRIEINNINKIFLIIFRGNLKKFFQKQKDKYVSFSPTSKTFFDKIYEKK